MSSAVDSGGHLVRRLQRSLDEHASRPLFGTKREGHWEWLSYRDFGWLVDRVRAGLAALGVGPGDRVAIIANNRVEWAAAAYATYGLAAAFVPMYEAQNPKEWQYILADCGAKVVFAATPAIAKRLSDMQSSLPALAHVVRLHESARGPEAADGEGAGMPWGALLDAGAGQSRAVEAIEPTTIAGLIYTSGTTGDPKGVLLSHENFASNVASCASILPVGADDRTVSFLPWAHAFGQTAELHLLVSLGASMAINSTVTELLTEIGEVKPTLFVSVPRIFNRVYDGVRKKMDAGSPAIRAVFRGAMAACAKERQGGKPSTTERVALAVARRVVFPKIRAMLGGRLRFAVSGGAALATEVAEFIDDIGITVYEGYGLTETSPVIAVNRPGARRIGTVGPIIPGVRVDIDVPPGSEDGEGEIVVHGPNVMQGYYGLPQEDAKVFTADRGFRTGDLGRIDADGFLSITGRTKELYKLGNGKYVSPAPIEEKLQLSPLVHQAMVYGDNHAFNVAVIVPDFASLGAWAKEHGITASEHASLVREPKVRELFRQELEASSKQLKKFEAIGDFVLAVEEWTTDNEMLTPKLSIKRRNVVKRYKREIDALYERAKDDRASS